MTKKWGWTVSFPSNLKKMNWIKVGLKLFFILMVSLIWNIGETGDIYVFNLYIKASFSLYKYYNIMFSCNLLVNKETIQ